MLVAVALSDHGGPCRAIPILRKVLVYCSPTSLALAAILERKRTVHETKEPLDKITLLARIKSCLQAVYGGRLHGVVLYGSEARGEATSDSDIDLLVLLTGPVALGRELRMIIKALSPLQLEIERPIHAMPVDINVYEAGEFALYRNAKREGILV